MTTHCPPSLHDYVFYTLDDVDVNRIFSATGLQCQPGGRFLARVTNVHNAHVVDLRVDLGNGAHYDSTSRCVGSLFNDGTALAFERQPSLRGEQPTWRDVARTLAEAPADVQAATACRPDEITLRPIPPQQGDSAHHFKDKLCMTAAVSSAEVKLIAFVLRICRSGTFGVERVRKALEEQRWVTDPPIATVDVTTAEGVGL